MRSGRSSKKWDVLAFAAGTTFFLFVFAALVAGQPAASSRQRLTRTITVSTSPGSGVWIDGVNYGKTDTSGQLTITAVSAGKHLLRVRADGFKESVRTISPTEKGVIELMLSKTSDEAELSFQNGEALTGVDRAKAAEAYRRAIKLRPVYADAYIGLARVLSDAGDRESALKVIADLRKVRPASAEASAVEGRILRDSGEEDAAIAAFKRAIREGGGFQPEAYTGLGLIFKEKAEGFGGEGDYEKEKANYAESSKYLSVAIKQLSGAPDAIVVYQLLGLVFEQQKLYKEAIAVYREFLKTFSNTPEASAVESFIVQLNKQLAQQ